MIDLLGGAPEALQLLTALAADGVAMSMITYLEVYQGVIRGRSVSRADASLGALVRGVPVLPFTRSTARLCAGLREALLQDGRRVRGRALDLMNAAVAIEYSLVLVTRNMRDYADVPGLQLYAWQDDK